MKNKVMPTPEQLDRIWEADMALGFNTENDYGRNIPVRQLPEFTGPTIGYLKYDPETQAVKITSVSESEEHKSNP